MIVLQDLSKETNGRPLLDRVSLSIFSAEKVALVGRRHSGKSTLMRILCGYLRPTTGNVRVGNYDLGRQSSQARRLIGYVPTDPPLYPELTVEQYLVLCASLRGLKRSAAESVAEPCELAQVWTHRINTLPRGLAQQINLAQALLHNPSFLLIDDPFVDLDPAERTTVLSILQKFAPNKTLLLATHNLDLLPLLCNRVLILHEGRISFDGELKQLSHFERLESAFLHYTPTQDIAIESFDWSPEA